MSTCASSLGLAALGLVSLGLAAAPAHAQTGAGGTNGGAGITLSGSFTINSPTSVAGTIGGNGSDGGSSGGSGGSGGTGGGGLTATGAGASISVLGGSFSAAAGGNGGNGSLGALGNGVGGGGGNGGVGFLATDTGSSLTVQGGSFSGGNGGNGGFGSGVGAGSGFGGNGGDGFAATGAGTTLSVLGGTFRGGTGGSSGVLVNRPAQNGNAFTTSTGETVSIFGGSFSSLPSSAGGGNEPVTFGNSFFVNGGNVTLYGVFSTVGGTPLTAPTTFTNTSGTFLGTLANNAGAATYSFDVGNGGTLTLAAPVPEASTTASFGLLLALGLGGMVVAAKRRKTASAL